MPMLGEQNKEAVVSYHFLFFYFIIYLLVKEK